MPAVYVEAHLESMWKPGYENGDPLLGDEHDVELAAEWEDSGRPPGEWFKAVLEARFIDETDEGYQIHDLHDNAPEYVSDRFRREIERRKPKRCRQCGLEYRSPDPRSLYCSSACRQKVFRDKHSLQTVTEVSVTRNEPLRSVTDSNGTPAPAPAPAPALNTPLTPLAGGTKRTRDLPDYTPEFERFWDAYPKARRLKKLKAFAAWLKALKRCDAETIIAAAAAYAASPSGQCKYTKGPEPWLNGGCWEDDRAAWQRGDDRSSSISEKNRRTFEAARQFLEGGNGDEN